MIIGRSWLAPPVRFSQRGMGQMGLDWYSIDRRWGEPGQAEIVYGQREQNTCGIPPRAGGAAPEGNSALRARLAQRALDRVEHLARAERLRQKAERLGNRGAAGRLVVGEAGQEDRRDPEFLAQHAGQFD